MKYKALRSGFDGIKVREIGEVFEYKGKPGKWMKLFDAKAEKEELKKASKPEASEPVKVDEDVI